MTTNDPLQENFDWYKEHLPKLYARYGECYLAIKDKHVIGSYDSYGEAVKETSKTETLGTFNVQKCGADESAYTARIFRVA